MKIGFRADASTFIGTGHVMRSLTLALELRSRGAICYFVCQDLEGNINELITDQGFEVRTFSLTTVNTNEGLISKQSKEKPISVNVNSSHLWREDAHMTKISLGETYLDWLVVDHYSLDFRWEKLLRKNYDRLMVIDDLANRVHDCDLLLDQNFYSNTGDRYLGSVPDRCVLLLGPTYSLLREEFVKTRNKKRYFTDGIKNILVFFGGSDPTNQTRLALEALLDCDLFGIDIHIVLGSAYSYKEELRNLVKSLSNIFIHEQINNMAELILNADLAIGAGGATTWERCYLGLPTLTVITAANQSETSQDLAQLGAIRILGFHTQLDVDDYKSAIIEMINSPDLLQDMSDIASGIVEPGTVKVAEMLVKH